MDPCVPHSKLIGALTIASILVIRVIYRWHHGWLVCMSAGPDELPRLLASPLQIKAYKLHLCDAARHVGL